MASKPLSGATKQRKKKDLQNEFKKRYKIDSFLLPAQNKKEENTKTIFSCGIRLQINNKIKFKYLNLKSLKFKTYSSKVGR